MDSAVGYIIVTILGAFQVGTTTLLFYLRRDVTKAQAELTQAQAELTQAQAKFTESQVSTENAQADKTTAEAFSTLTQTISQMGAQYSGNLTQMMGDYTATLTKMIDAMNAREKKIDDLELDSRQKDDNLKELQGHYSELAVTAAQSQKELDLVRDSVNILATANKNQSEEITELKADVLTLQREGVKKDNLLKERDSTIADLKRERDADNVLHAKELRDRDDRILQLERKVRELETKINKLEQASPAPDIEPKEAS